MTNSQVLESGNASPSDVATKRFDLSVIAAERFEDHRRMSGSSREHVQSIEKMRAIEKTRDFVTKRNRGLGIEANQIDKLELGVNRVIDRQCIDEYIETTYPQIDLSFLSLQSGSHIDFKTDKTIGFSYVLPHFALYHIDSPTIEIAWNSFYFNVAIKEKRQAFILGIGERGDYNPEGIPYGLSNSVLEQLSPQDAGTVFVEMMGIRHDYFDYIANITIDYGSKIKESTLKRIIVPIKDAISIIPRKKELWTKWKDEWGFGRGGQAFYYDKISIKSTFNGGLLPDNIFELILRERKLFDNEIYVIAEAEWNCKWEQKQVTVPTPNRDPLVIGVRNGKTYLLAAFDCTPVEDYVAKEFTMTRQLGDESK